MGITKKTSASVLLGKYPHETIPSCATLETYDENPIYITVNIPEDAVKSVT